LPPWSLTSRASHLWNPSSQWYRGWRLGAVDGTTLDVADTPANDAVMALTEIGSGAHLVM